MSDRLESWKEIAAYLGREVRTVQGWEKNEGLPIHRHQHSRQGTVYAFRSELDTWLNARTEAVETAIRSPGSVTNPAPNEAVRQTNANRRRVASITAAVVVIGVVIAGAGWQIWRARANGDRPSSVVVLPFLDLSPEKNQEYFSDGLTEEIIDELSRLPNLHVVARTSAFVFKGKPADIREIGQKLQVNTVLEGSVRKSGDQLRITVQLNRVSDGYHLWSRTFDRKLRDVFEIERDIAQSVANQMRAGKVPRIEPTADLEAYRLYQEAQFLFNQHIRPESYLKAADRFRQAIKRDPNFALAHAGLAESYAYLAETGSVAPNEVMPKAKESAEKAVRLDPNSGEAHISLGIVKLDYEWDRAAGQAEFRKALQLNPSSSWAHHWFAHSLEAQAKLDEALKEMRAALALDPLSVAIRWDIGGELIAAKRYDEALTHIRKSLELFPNHPVLRVQQAVALYRLGDRAAGNRIIESLTKDSSELPEGPDKIGLLAFIAATEGRVEEARAGLRSLERLSQDRYVEPMQVTQICYALHDRECVVKWFRRAVEVRSAETVYAAMYPEIYDDPEIHAMRAQIR